MIRKCLLLFALIAASLQAQDWQKVTEASLNNMYDIYFMTETEGFGVGSYGSIYHTKDGGLNWEAKDSPYSSSLYAVWFTTNQKGFIGTGSDVFLKTVDGGSTWVKDTLSGANGKIIDLWFADENTGYALVSKSTGGQVFKTIDGGENWTKQLQAEKDLLAFAFNSENVGVVTGKYLTDVYYTENGTDWNKSTVGELGGHPYTRSDLRTVTFIDATTAYASGWGSDAAGLQPSIHLKSTDAGKTWTYMNQAPENRTYVNIYDVYFKDAQNGVAVGGNSIDGGLFLKTTDGGVNWTQVKVGAGASIEDIFVKNNKSWFLGNGSALYASDTDWNNFNLISKLPSAYMYTMSVKGNQIIAGGFYGMIMKSEDLGNNWTASYTGIDGKCPKLTGLFFVDENLGFASKNKGQLLKTTNGGDTWQEVIPASASFFASYNDVFFVDANNGFTVGEDKNRNPIISSTTDGGQTWEDNTSAFSEELNAVYFSTALTGVAGGKKLSLGYTEDGGKTWNTATQNNVPSSLAYSAIEDIEFLNPQFGIAVGKKLVLKTTDGGKNWDYVEIPGITVTLKAVQIIDQNTWVAAGSKTIYRTTDGGANWENIENSEIDQSVYALYYDENNTLWACGANSSIFKYANFTSVEEITNEVPTTLALSQNYPNPFNPSTMIEFSVPVECKVKVEVFNILGEKVKTVYNEFTQPGTYKVKYNGTNNSGSTIPSGIYFYRISTPEKSITRKMIFMK